MTVLLGQSADGGLTTNQNLDGQACSQRCQAIASGTVDTIWLHTAGTPAPTTATGHAAIYSDTAGPNPSTRLTGDLQPASNFTLNAWNSITIPGGLAVVGGTFYWIAWLCVGSALNYTDFATSGGTTSDSASGQTGLASTWADGSNFSNIFNTYADGTLAAPAAVEARVDFEPVRFGPF